MRADPYVVVLGTAQDAGLPQIGCDGAHCAAARRDPARARLVTSLLVVDPRGGRRWLVDATPDLGAQMDLARGHAPGRAAAGPRPPLVEGVFLTHAHMGHYAGLLELGPEAYGARGVAVWGTPRMAAFLRANDPWRFLVEGGVLRLSELEPGRPVQLAPRLSIEALPVPHRDELSDTVAFVIRGPSASLLYLPDIDKWERWDVPLERALASVDVALVDGTFFAAGEVPGRDMAAIPHPFVVETLERLAPAPPALRAKVLFTHLNHTNPLVDPGSPERRRVRAAGLDVAAEGRVIQL